MRQGLKTFSNWPTYPQLYAHGELVGGLDILKVREGEGGGGGAVVGPVSLPLHLAQELKESGEIEAALRSSS